MQSCKLGIIKEAFKDSFPIIIGYFPMATAFGILATGAGFKPLEGVAMSVFVFAGAAQFISVAMISSGGAISAIVATTFLVNLRHVLMSASFAGYLKDARRQLLPIFSFGVTDETYAVNIENFREGNGNFKRSLMVNFMSYSSWVGGTVTGVTAGNLIPTFFRESLYFALPAMFIGLLFLAIRTRLEVVVGIFSAVISTFFFLKLGGNTNIILTAILGATFGVFLEKWMQK